MIDLLQVAGVYAIVIITAVEAIRARVPRIDGPWVLALSALVSAAIAALFLPPASGADAIYAARIALLAWLIAVGGDAWTAKLASRFGAASSKGPDNGNL
jgi:hypothetical protein